MRRTAVEPFTPGATVSLAVSTSSARVALPNAPGLVDQQVRIFNASDATVFVEIGGATVDAATATSMPIPAGLVEVLTLTQTQTARYLAGIRASGSGTIYATVGGGS